MYICKPHLMMMTTHMSTAGSNALSASMRFAVPTAGCPPPKLLEPTRLMVPLPRNHHCPRTGCDSPAIQLVDAPLLYYHSNGSCGVPRSGTGAWSGRLGSSAAALPNFPSQAPRIHATARRTRAASRRSSGLPVETPHRESPPGRQSQPRGVRAHGALPEAENRCGAGTRWIADHSTVSRRSSNLACTNEATPCGESPDGTTPRIQTAQRRESERPHGRDTREFQRPPGRYNSHTGLRRSEWGMRGAPVHLHPSRPDGSPPSTVRRHHKPENADEHSASSMSPHILPALCVANMFRNTRTSRELHSDSEMFLNARSCCSDFSH